MRDEIMGKAESGQRIGGVVDLFFKEGTIATTETFSNFLKCPPAISLLKTPQNYSSYCALQKHWDSLYTK